MAKDQKQSFWELAGIQAAAVGIPGMLVGGQIAKAFGFGTAILSICLGNLLLWIIELAVISMTSDGNENAIENVARYLGKFGKIVTALFFIVSFLMWFVIQIKGTETAINSLVVTSGYNKNGFGLKVGIALGLLISILSMGGIRLIKRVCIFSLPLLAFLVVYLCFFTSSTIKISDTWHLSWSGVVLIMVSKMPAALNLPTFFRHSQSKQDSLLALTFMTVLFIFFQSSMVLVGAGDIETIFSGIQKESFSFTATLMWIFIVFSAVGVNLVNIYFASAGFQAIAFRPIGAKGLIIIGLLGTAIYTFIQAPSTMFFLENLSNGYIASLGMILIISFLIKTLVKYRKRSFQKTIGITCWFVGCLISTLLLCCNSSDAPSAIVGGAAGSVLAFLIVVFFEEIIWSVKKLSSRPSNF